MTPPAATLAAAAAAAAAAALLALALTPRVRRYAETWWHLPAAAGLAGLAAFVASSPAELAGLTLVAASFGSLLAVDAAVHRLPRPLLWPVAVAVPVLALAAVAPDYVALRSAATWSAPPLGSALGAAGVFVAFFLVLGLASRGALGFGDVVLAPFVGFVAGYYGWGAAVAALLATFLLSGLYATALLAIGRATRSSHVAFGPWMVLGGVVGIAVGA